MSNDVIKELLVAVLTRFDEASAKQALDATDKAQGKITDKEKKGADTRNKNLAGSLAEGLKHVQGYTKSVAQLGERVALSLAGIALSIEGAAVSGTFALARLSKEMSNAYYSGQKLGSAVKDMDAFRYASEQAGSSAAKAQAGLEELGRLKNTNPAAYVGLLQRLGVAATDAAGKLRAPAQAAMDLAPALAKQSRQMQLLFGNQLGMDDDQTLAMVRPEFLAQIKQYQEMQKAIGFDPDKAATDGASFERIWTKMWTAVDLVSKKVQAAFFNQVGGSVDKVTDWLVKNSGRISDLAIKVGDYVLHLATSIIDLVGNFDKLNPSTQRLIEMLGGLAAALFLLKAGPIGTILALAGALGVLWDDYEKYKQGLPSVVDWAKWEPQIKAAIEGLTSLWNKFDELSTKLTGQGGAQTAMEAFAAYMAGAWVAKILGGFNAVSGGWLALLARFALANPAILGTAAIGAALASGDPNKALVDGGHPDLGPRDNDLGLPGLEHEDLPENKSPSDPGRMLGAWNWLKGKLGLGADDPDAQRIKDAILATAEATKKMADGTKAGGEGASFGPSTDTGVGGAGGSSLRYGRDGSGAYRRGGHGGGGRNYADTPDGSGRPGAVKGSEGDRAMAAMNYLVDRKGWTPEGAAIAVGNAMQESGVNPNGRPGDPNTPGGSHYMFQWNNGRNNDTVNGRRALYEKWIRANNRDVNDYRSPLDFMDEERKHRSGLEGQWHKQTDFRNAGRLGHLFEGYGDNSEGTRVQNARDALAAFNRTRSNSLATSSPAASLDSAHQKLADAMRAVGAGKALASVPTLQHALGVTPSLYQTYDHSRSTTASPTVNQNINIHGVQNPHDIGAHLKVHAKRGVQDSLRNLQGQSG